MAIQNPVQVTPTLEEIRNIATFSILGQMSSLKHTSSNRYQGIYNNNVELLMEYYHPPYHHPTWEERFMRWFDNLCA